jgi:AI-2 transport protein TqsA
VTFGVLSFLLNFIPNVGMPTSVVLPMPLVLLDPSFHFGGIAFTFAAPIGCGLAIKDVLEPLLIGHRTSLQPVAVLMSIMVWGSVWGLTGMILAVPLTAVARMQLARLEHPLPRFMAGVLSGNAEDEDGGELRAEAANKMIIARELLAGPAAQQW